MISLPDLCKELHFSHLEAGLPPLLEEARTHALTYDAFLRRALLEDERGP